jgi:hypothetical protein
MIDCVRMLRSVRTWDTGIDINFEDGTSYTTQYQEALLKYAENAYCTNHRQLPVTKCNDTLKNNLSFFEIASISDQSPYNPHDLSSNDKEYLMPTNGAEMMPG